MIAEGDIIEIESKDKEQYGRMNCLVLHYRTWLDSAVKTVEELVVAGEKEWWCHGKRTLEDPVATIK